MQRCLQITSVAIILGLPSAHAAGSVLFSDDFEGDLSQWVGKGGGAHSGVIVNDPVRANNRVVTFTSIVSAGDIFGTEIAVTPGNYLLEFEYLGVPGLGGTPGNLGGLIGIAEGTPDGHRWLDGTSFFRSNTENDSLVDDGVWRNYSIVFDPFDRPYIGVLAAPPNPSNNTIRVMLEDFDVSGGVAGDAFFDNIRFTRIPDPTVIPEPTTLVVWSLLGLSFYRRRRQRA